MDACSSGQPFLWPRSVGLLGALLAFMSFITFMTFTGAFLGAFMTFTAVLGAWDGRQQRTKGALIAVVCSRFRVLT